MQPEQPVHRFDLGRFDKAGMRDRDRMQGTFERFLPEFQKALQLGKFGAEIIGLPDIGLQQPGMSQVADIGFVPWSDRSLSSASENLSRSCESPVLDDPSFPSNLGYGKPKNKVFQ